MGDAAGKDSNKPASLTERHPELQFYDPPKKAVRVPRLLEGMNCMVGESSAMHNLRV
jgi:hypothetical protein